MIFPGKAMQGVLILIMGLICVELKADLSISEAVNVAGRQRMLSQRIVKSYLQLGLRVAPAQSRQQLEDALDLFTSQLETLTEYAPTDKIQTQLNRVDQIWRQLRQVALDKPQSEQVDELNRLSDVLLDESDRAVVMLEQLSGTRKARLVNIAGRQRMLSQRLAKLYLMRAWVNDSIEVQRQIDQAQREFSSALQELQSARENTPTIIENLADVAEQWDSLSSALNVGGREFFPLIVADASDKVLVLMDRITHAYAGLTQPHPSMPGLIKEG